MKVKVSTVAFSKNKYLVDALVQEFPDAVVNDAGQRLQDSQLIEYLHDADAAIIGLEQINGAVLDQLPSLKMIAKYGVGLDNIDLEACKSRNVTIGWTGGVNKRSVAEMSLGFMLALIRNLYITSNQLKQQVWNKNGGFQLSGKTIGIIGIGNIGRELVGLLKPFNCRILGNDIVDIKSFADENNLEVVTKEKLIAESDIISIHTPLTEQTKNLFNEYAFSQMKENAFLINTARGGIVNENDLKKALMENRIAGAALDVFEHEPPTDQELLACTNLICTPHTGGNANEAVVAMGLSAIQHLKAYRQNIIKSEA